MLIMRVKNREGVKQNRRGGKATVNFALEKAFVEFDDTSVKGGDFANHIMDLGYEVIRENKKNTTERKPGIRGGCCG